LDYGKALNQRLHAWPYRKLVEILRYKGALMGIKVYEVEERKTSLTCHACGKVTPGAIHLLLRLEGAGGCQRGPERLPKGFPGISRQGE
jgi:transposase